MFEKRAPTHSSPPPSAPKNKEAVLGRLCFASSPTQVPTAEAPENKEGGTPTDYVFRGPRPPARHCLPLYSRYGRVAALGSGCAAEPKASRRRGAVCVVFQGLFSVVNYRSPLQSLALKPYKANVGPIVGVATIFTSSSHIGHVRLAPLSDVSDIERGFVHAPLRKVAC